MIRIRAGPCGGDDYRLTQCASRREVDHRIRGPRNRRMIAHSRSGAATIELRMGVIRPRMFRRRCDRGIAAKLVASPRVMIVRLFGRVRVGNAVRDGRARYRYPRAQCENRGDEAVGADREHWAECTARPPRGIAPRRRDGRASQPGPPHQQGVRVRLAQRSAASTMRPVQHIHARSAFDACRPPSYV